MNSKSKGNLGEIKVASEFIKWGCTVSFPFGDNARYDLVIDDGNNLKRVQIKYADSKSANGSWRCVCVSSTNHTTNKKLHDYQNDVDIIAFYIAELDECIMFNISEVKDKLNIYVRNTIPSNNQSNVTYIKDHTFDNYFKKA
jgi:hypothetical protein